MIPSAFYYSDSLSREKLLTKTICIENMEGAGTSLNFVQNLQGCFEGS